MRKILLIQMLLRQFIMIQTVPRVFNRKKATVKFRMDHSQSRPFLLPSRLTSGSGVDIFGTAYR
jgi:hypothetical protein